MLRYFYMRMKIQTSKSLLDYYLNFNNKYLSSESYFMLNDGLVLLW